MMPYPELPTGRQRQQVYDECHVYRHWWQPTTVTAEGRFYVQHMVCMRCTMERRWKVNRQTGDPASNGYTAPEGYYRKHADNVDAQQARKELRLAEIERNRTTRKIRRVV